MAEVSSDDALWRRFCPEGNDHHTVRSPPDNSGFAAGDDGGDGDKKQRHAWKSRYMEWLRPNLHQFAHSQQGTRDTRYTTRQPTYRDVECSETRLQGRQCRHRHTA